MDNDSYVRFVALRLARSAGICRRNVVSIEKIKADRALIKPLRALLLAAGFGTRLRHLGN